MSHIGNFDDAEKKSKSAEDISNKSKVSPADRLKLTNGSNAENRYSKMSDNDFNKHVKSLDRNTAPNNLIYDGSNKNRNKSPFINQEDNKYYPDAWGNKSLKSGDKLYSLGSSKGHDSPYYTDKKTVDACRRKDGSLDKNKLKDKLQISDPDNKKNTLREYDVNKDFVTGGGKAKENGHNGRGGGTQFFINDDDKKNLSKGRKIR